MTLSPSAPFFIYIITTQNEIRQSQRIHFPIFPLRCSNAKACVNLICSKPPKRKPFFAVLPVVSLFEIPCVRYFFPQPYHLRCTHQIGTPFFNIWFRGALNGCILRSLHMDIISAPVPHSSPLRVDLSAPVIATGPPQRSSDTRKIRKILPKLL